MARRATKFLRDGSNSGGEWRNVRLIISRRNGHPFFTETEKSGDNPKNILYKSEHKLRKRKVMNIQERVKNIICDQLAVEAEKVTDTASFIDDLGADSLDIVELVMTMEEEFDLDIPDEDAEKMKTVGDVIKYIEEKAAA